MANKIEYYEELVTLKEIARRKGFIYSTLKKYYDQTGGDIYKAIEICEKVSKGKQEKIEYNGKLLTIEGIARKEKINSVSLKHNYDKTGNIYDAVELTREKARKPIEYYGKMLLLADIAKIEDLGITSLRVCYRETDGDIYEAVKLCRERSKGPHDRILYNGKIMTIGGIAKEEELHAITLKRHYLELGDIYKAVEKARVNSLQKIQYYKEELPISVIAERAQIGRDTLKRWYNKTDKNIYEAVKICNAKKNKQEKPIKTDRKNITEIYDKINKKTTEIENIKISTYDLSLLIGVKHRDLINLLNTGLSIEKIKEMYGNNRTSESDILKNSLNNRVNISFLYRALETYGRNLNESIKIYEIKNIIPQGWIKAKYAQAFEVLPSDDAKWILYFMQCEYLSLEEAIEKQVIEKLSEENRISNEWGETLYTLAKGRELLGNEFNKQVIISENEKIFVKAVETEIKEIKNRIKENLTCKQPQKIENDVIRD